jgi:hypothetical protein
MTTRVILGAFDGTFVLRASKPGFNVLDPALTKEQLAFDSRYFTAARVLSQGTLQGQLEWADMVGWSWYAPSPVYLGGSWDPNELPYVIVVPRSNFDYNMIGQSNIGGFFTMNGGYDSVGKTIGIGAGAAWWPLSGNYTRLWGWFDYWVVKP